MKLFFLISMMTLSAKPNLITVVQSVSKPLIHIGDEPAKVLVSKTELKTDFKLKTLNNQFAKFKLAQNIEVSVFSDTEVNFAIRDSSLPSVRFSIELISGEIYVQKKTDSNLDLKSDFLNWSLHKDQVMDLVIKYDKSKAQVQFCNRDKIFEVSLFDHEKKITLNAADSVIFQGQIENQSIAFDILLNQRKIPKGQWQQVLKCHFSEIMDQEKKLLLEEAAVLSQIKSGLQKIKNKKAADDAKYLCHKPYGQLNECHWKKTNKNCIRSRCNAQGSWSDSQAVSIGKSTQCQSQSTVSMCDY